MKVSFATALLLLALNANAAPLAMPAGPVFQTGACPTVLNNSFVVWIMTIFNPFIINN